MSGNWKKIIILHINNPKIRISKGKEKTFKVVKFRATLNSNTQNIFI